MTRLLVCVVALVLTACTHAEGTGKQQPQQKPAVQQPPNEARALSTTGAQALAEFNDRVTKYAELHRRLEATLPKLPKETQERGRALIAAINKTFEKIDR